MIEDFSGSGPAAGKTARRAVFLDRDGTINVEKDYLYRIADFEFIPGVPQALKLLQDAGFLLVVVTNQSGVARGYYSLDDVDLLHQYMRRELKKFGIKLDGIYVCPHHPTLGHPPYRVACGCRKGAPGLLLQAAQELNIDLSRSFMVGDKLADFEAGIRAGCTSCLVASGHLVEGSTDLVVYPDLLAVAQMILEAGRV
jgi:D-glycero-D-manno-heptose 1,7-bisphosphate phosphatase